MKREIRKKIEKKPDEGGGRVSETESRSVTTVVIIEMTIGVDRKYNLGNYESLGVSQYRKLTVAPGSDLNEIFNQQVAEMLQQIEGAAAQDKVEQEEQAAEEDDSAEVTEALQAALDWALENGKEEKYRYAVLRVCGDLKRIEDMTHKERARILAYLRKALPEAVQ